MNRNKRNVIIQLEDQLQAQRKTQRKPQREPHNKHQAVALRVTMIDVKLNKI